ncbi:hypothetical protein [Thalassoroseus pseudoceratinae]|uniref:hypothetical protein n=1 Tax=Thalassoroseus pseudoceratinae TaxID=2713176 RepID=UPI001F0FEAF1|nr:hypothetical protein [Thalassoroseus pseudoceratinae]
MPYTLFTFGDNELPYYLVLEPDEPGGMVAVRRGQVNITRPQLITPDTLRPEFQDFFDETDGEHMIDFLLSRTAAFSNLRMVNRRGSERLVTDSVEEAVAKLERELDDEEEDRVAILSGPKPLAGMAVLRYVADRVTESAPGNIQELRDRGFLS